MIKTHVHLSVPMKIKIIYVAVHAAHNYASVLFMLTNAMICGYGHLYAVCKLASYIRSYVCI